VTFYLLDFGQTESERCFFKSRFSLALFKQFSRFCSQNPCQSRKHQSRKFTYSSWPGPQAYHWTIPFNPIAEYSRSFSMDKAMMLVIVGIGIPISLFVTLTMGKHNLIKKWSHIFTPSTNLEGNLFMVFSTRYLTILFKGLPKPEASWSDNS